MSRAQLAQRVEDVQQANRRVLARTAHRRIRLERAAAVSVRIVDRAVRRLRTGV